LRWVLCAIISEKNAPFKAKNYKKSKKFHFHLRPRHCWADFSYYKPRLMENNEIEELINKYRVGCDFALSCKLGGNCSSKQAFFSPVPEMACMKLLTSSALKSRFF